MSKKQKSTRPRKLDKQRLLIIGGSILLFLLALYLLRGWVRMTVIPKAVTVYNNNSVQKAYNQEMTNLQDPFMQLGLSAGHVVMKGCNTSVANELKTQVVCNYQVRAWAVVDTSSEGQEKLKNQAARVQSLLQQNGWQGEYTDTGDYTSLTKLVSSLNSSIDYQSDASYQKQIGDVSCMLSANTAYSEPDPVAIAMNVFCTRTFNILGEPSWN